MDMQTEITLLKGELEEVQSTLAKKEKMLEIYERQAKFDAVTGLGSTNSYIEYLGSLNVRALSSIGIILSDINGMQLFNQKYGKEYGTEILKKIADTFLAAFEGHSVFRIGSDEIGIICENITKEDFNNRFQKAKLGLLSTDGEGISAGAKFVENPTDLDQIIKETEILLQKEKEKYHENKQRRGTRANFAALKQLMDDINNKRYEVYLQPKVDCKTGKLSGAEALARFKNSENLYVLPKNFVPSLERESLIRYLDIFVFEEVCRLIALWKIKGYDIVPLSFNFSKVTLLEPNIVKMVHNIHANYKIPKELLEIEVMESASNSEIEDIENVVKEFNAEGFSVALDGFGTQHVSLAMLIMLDVQRIKLDRKLISDIDVNEKSRVVAEHAVKMGRALGLHVTAAGVENQEQYDILKNTECEELQGFLFDKPMSITDFEKKYML
ncbi:MAG: GGDEF domain-containing phosphodiesterase [Clostridia bacterium]|nr:GGDEF domain-containing phosphodiesterase [Clostridia bacterium]